ncbi:MAG: sugar phosphate isomerase/epimerase [Clostridia bacterium]|nr:sugar phosphate isomerase/epimerase [Clostridia bacterium]
MKISSNFIRFHNELGLKKTIDVFSKAGFEAIDFNADFQEYYTDVHNKDFYQSIKEYAGDRGIVFSQTHAPFSSSYVDEKKTERRFGEIVKSMEHSAWLGADMVVVHPCKHIDYKDNNYNLMMDYNLDFYKRLIPYAEEFGIKIAIENIGGCITETPKGLLELLNTLNNDAFTLCYDVGHANICGQNPSEMIREIGKYIGCTHIHDNDGIHDTHTLPYYGTIDWESVMKAFAESGYEGNLNYEAGIFVDKVPIELREDSARYMARVAKHLVERYCYYKNNG